MVGGGSIFWNKPLAEKNIIIAKRMKGKVMISYDNHPRVKRACKGLKFKKINHTYILNKRTNNKGKPVTELLITNF